MSSSTVVWVFYGRRNYFVGKEHLVYKFCLPRAWKTCATNYHSLSLLTGLIYT